MLEVQHCPCCGSGRLRSYAALTAAFIADYVLARPRHRVRLLECRDCSFRFYACRFDDDEVRRLYTHYRGPAYYEARHLREFWYTKKINDSIGENPAEIASRNQTMLEFIRTGVDPDGIETVLDYGGDRGQFIPGGLGKERSVFEISGLAPVEGVSMIASKEALAGRSFDLILLANVLEHSSEPKGLLRELRGLAQEKGSSLLVTVPLERYGLGFIPTRGVAKKLYEKFLDAAAASPRLARLLDFYSAVSRVKLGMVPPWGYLTLHEHINFFNEASLRSLLEAAGFRVLSCRTARLGTSADFGDSILCLAQASRARDAGETRASTEP